MQKQYKHFLVRPWQPQDRHGVVDLAKHVLAEYDMLFDPDGADWDVVQVEAAYWKTGGEFLVVEFQGQVVGSGGYHPCDRTTTINNRGVELRKMFLRPEQRGQGLGRYLLTLLEQSAASKGYTQMWLETAARMQAAIAMYERHGYHQPDNQEIHVQRCDRVYVKTLLS